MQCDSNKGWAGPNWAIQSGRGCLCFGKPAALKGVMSQTGKLMLLNYPPIFFNNLIFPHMEPLSSSYCKPWGSPWSGCKIHHRDLWSIESEVILTEFLFTHVCARMCTCLFLCGAFNQTFKKVFTECTSTTEKCLESAQLINLSQHQSGYNLVKFTTKE